MAEAQLLEYAKQGDLDKFENACLQAIDGGKAGGKAPLTAFVRPFQKLERAQAADRVATLAQTLLENGDAEADPAAALSVARSALFAAPKSEQMRLQVVDLYRKVHAETPGFSDALEASGLTGDRPARAALKLISVYLDIKPGDTFMGRTDDRAVETLEIDRANGILTLRRQDRTVTVPAAELAREYDRVDPSDFRVMRQLWPDKLSRIIESDPVALIVGVLYAHGELMDAEQLKDELVPRVIEAKNWTKWWTSARAQLKRAPNIRIEGRSPVTISLLHEAVSMEQETASRFVTLKDPDHWLTTIEAYLRDKTAVGEKPSPELLKGFHDEIVAYITAIGEKRPAEALACALLIPRLADKGMPATESSQTLAKKLLAEAADPVKLIRSQKQDLYWARALELLPDARPNDWLDVYAQLLPAAPASQLDTMAEALMKNGRSVDVQTLVDLARTKLLDYPEAEYWLWKGPKLPAGLDIPTPVAQLRHILDTWNALNRATGQQADKVKEFRAKMKAALSLRDYGFLRKATEQLDAGAAITVRRQLERIDGVGDTLRSKALEILRDVHPHLWHRRVASQAAWEDERFIFSTQLGIERKLAEREDIENVQMRDNARRIGEAAQLGDLSENSEYKFALEERDLLRARLARVNEDLSMSQAIDPLGVQADHVSIGTKVRFRNLESGKDKWMTFFGPFDTVVERGIYSYQAPMSQAVMGKKVGERMRLTIEGPEAEYEVGEIHNALGQ